MSQAPALACQSMEEFVLFGLKKKLFGSQIEINCDYCSHNTGTEEEPKCSKGLTIKEGGSCRRFAYDPLMRTPRALPPLREYDMDDFTL